MASEVVAMVSSTGNDCQMKCTRKLYNNDNARGEREDGHNPAYKDKTTLGHNGYGEPGSGIFERVRDKPGVSKGGQIMLLSEISRVRPCAYLHRHKLHKLPPGWT
eukprot:15333256-Ditylum_brightwellii.AAC.1